MSGTSTFQRMGRIFLSLGGIGFLPRWSPTIATAVSAVLLWASDFILPPQANIRAFALLATFVTLFALAAAALYYCVPSSHYDQRYVVIDEFLGMLVALFPALASGKVTPVFTCWAFVVFRVIDHTKPLGIRSIDHCNSPWTALLDDVVAGAYTAFILAVTVGALPLFPLPVLAPGAA